MAEKSSGIVAIIFIVALIVLVGKFWPSGSSAAPVQVTQPPAVIQQNQTAPVCAFGQNNLIVGNSEDYYTGAKLPFLSHRLYSFDNGAWNDLGSVADGTVKILTPGQIIRVLYNFNGSKTTGYPDMVNFTIPCSGGAATSALDGGAYRLVNKTSVAFIQTVVRNTDGTINSATSNQSLANKTRTMNFEIDFPQNSGFGVNDQNMHGMMLACSWNSTSISRISLASGNPIVGVPARIKAPNNLLLSGFEFPAVQSGGIIRDKLVVEPTTTSGNSESINCTGLDRSWFIPNNANVPMLDYQDNLFNDVGGDDFSFSFNLTG